jgi:hypothetical protein
MPGTESQSAPSWRLGAFACMPKPFDVIHRRLIIEQALKTRTSDTGTDGGETFHVRKTCEGDTNERPDRQTQPDVPITGTAVLRVVL